MSEALCACTFPHAVNQYEARYHCDRCGYPLGPDDRRHALLKLVGLETWAMLAHFVDGYSASKKAWNFLEWQLGMSTPKPEPQVPVRSALQSGQHMRMQFRFMLDP